MRVNKESFIWGIKDDIWEYLQDNEINDPQEIRAFGADLEQAVTEAIEYDIQNTDKGLNG